MDRPTAVKLCDSITGEDDPRFRAVTEQLGSPGIGTQCVDLGAIWAGWVQFSGSRDSRGVQQKISKVLKGGFENLILSVLAHEIDLIARHGRSASVANDLQVIGSMVPGEDRPIKGKDAYRFLSSLICHHAQGVALSILAFEGKGLPAVSGLDVRHLASLLSNWSESPGESCEMLRRMVVLIDNDLGARAFSKDSRAEIRRPDPAGPGNKEMALALLVQHPEWTDTRIASEAGMQRTQLYRFPEFVEARKAIRAGRPSRKAFRDPRTGNLEVESG